MKEIWKVVQKLSHENNSAAGGGGVPTGTKTGHPPVYRGDIISKLDIMENFMLGNTLI